MARNRKASVDTSAFEAVAQKCRDKATEYLRVSRDYKCRSTEITKHGYIKGAATLTMVAGWIEEAINEQGVDQGTRIPEAVEQGQDANTGTDTSAGSVDVPEVRTDEYGRDGGGSYHSAFKRRK